MKKLIFLTFLLIILSFVGCEKEKSYRVFNEVSFISDEKILQEYFVTAIDFDSKGVAWIGTFNQGLIKYDHGYVTVYNTENSPLDSSYIYDVKVDKKDVVWIGSNGLIKFDGNAFTRYDNSNSLIPENFVSAIAIDKINHLWLSSSRFQQGGLVEFDGTNWKLFTPDNSAMPCHLITDIEIDSLNNIWIALGEKVNHVSLVKISNQNWSLITDENFGFEPYYWGTLVSTPDNSVVASIDYGLSSLFDISRPNLIIGNKNKWKINNPTDAGGNSLGYVRTLCCDKKGLIWAALDLNPEYKKLAVYNGQKWFVNNDNLESTDIFTMKADNENRIWLGTGSGIQIIKSIE
ncbi:MAG: hypothetical protein U0W24_07535 [Bacteroidales bacterium]